VRDDLYVELTPDGPSLYAPDYRGSPWAFVALVRHALGDPRC
jgi:hypothetical protein